MLNQTPINYASWWRINKLTTSVLDEESLSDALVDYNERNLWLVASRIVHFGESLAKLKDLFVDDLLSHSISDAISEDYEVCWKFTIVMLGKDADSALKMILHLSLHYLFTFPLNDMLTEVLAEFGIDACSESDH